MIVEKDRVVTFHYVLKDEDGSTLEDTHDGEPSALLFGHGGTLRGVETALAQHSAGDHVEVTLRPDEAFGPRIEGKIERISKKYLQTKGRLKPGVEARVNTSSGPRTVTVVKVGAKMVDVDTNHVLAGKTVTFAIDIVGVREAEPAEIAHGHVHGLGGHQH